MSGCCRRPSPCRCIRSGAAASTRILARASIIFYGQGGTQDIGGQKAKVNYDNDFGYALQAGFNYQIDDSWFFNLDVKKLYVSTTARVVLDGVGEATRANVDLDPWLIGVGLGYRF